MILRIFIVSLLISLTALSGCGTAVSTELADVCDRPIGTKVEISGYISIPKETTILQHMKNGEIGETGVQLRITADHTGTGDSVMAAFWTSSKAEPNRIKPAWSNGYVSKDLILYLDDGSTSAGGTLVRLSGVTVSDERFGCYVNVDRITMIP